MNYIDDQDNNSIDHESDCQTLGSHSHSHTHSEKDHPFTDDLNGKTGTDVKKSSMFSPTHKRRDLNKGGSAKRDDEEQLDRLGMSKKAKSFALQQKQDLIDDQEAKKKSQSMLKLVKTELKIRNDTLVKHTSLQPKNGNLNSLEQQFNQEGTSSND